MNEHGAVIMVGKQKYSEKTLYQCHVIHHKFLMDWPSTDSGLLWCEAYNINLNCGWTLLIYWIFLQIQIYHALQIPRNIWLMIYML
jgi:hypothetical protein